MKRLLWSVLLIVGLLGLLGCTIQPSLNSETPDTTTAQETTNEETTTQEDTAPLTEEDTTLPEPTQEETTPTETTQEDTTLTEPPHENTTLPEPTQEDPPLTEPTQEETTLPEPTQDETTAAPTSPLSEGWQEHNGKRYYRDADGDLHTGFLELDGARYYFGEDGAMATGCVEIPGLGKRYFTSTGKEVVLVNPWNFVPEEYTVALGTYDGYSMAKHIIEPLKQMLADCRAAGHTAIVCSAYRSHEYQINLHNRRIQRFLDQGYSEEDAKREAARRVAVPGTSEHELGLALDIVDIDYQSLDEHQQTMPAQQWLMKNSWKYGFILRYPNETSEVTGIIYEPWHYRYVGTELAKELHDSGLCLEEYLQQLTA